MYNNPIGIFDSGMGGLTVLHQAMISLPKENYLYYADTDNVPYGLKTNEQIKKYVDDAVEFMIRKKVKAIVIACNTATSINIENLRKRYTLPIVGIEPAVKPAIRINKEKRIMLMATPVTVRERKLKQLLKEVDKNNKVDLLPLPGLVKFAENEKFDTREVKDYLKNELRNFNLSNYSEIILGCTHFNYFKPVIRKVFPEHIRILDGSKGTVNRLSTLLRENNLLGNNTKAKIQYYFSGRKIEDKEILNKIERLHIRLEKMLDA